MKNIETQYNDFSTVYTANVGYDAKSIAAFYGQVNFALKGKKLLDIGCGGGGDLAIFAAKGAIVHGIDPSAAFIAEAHGVAPGAHLSVGVGEELPFEDESFDIVVSKWALQTSPDVSRILREASRVLRPGGILLFLTKHPWMQWMEKVREYGHGADYYEQMIVTSNIFDGKIVLKEPSHTIGDYFNKEFYSNFEVLDYVEDTDFPASEQIGGDVYPTFFVVKARRK